MSSKSLGTLTLDIVAKTGGFTAGMSEAERAAQKSADKIQASIKSIGVAGYAVGTALGGFLKDGISAVAAAFPQLIEQAAQFQDIAEKTGGSAEGFASLAVSAKVGGTSMEELTAASIKLTKSLTGVDDESKAAGAALTALGIPIADFKKLAPEQQLLKVSEALGGFAEGSGKTAVAVDLFGKAGANLLPTLKDLYEQGGAQKILTDAQIKQADDYADAQTRLKAQIGLYASAIASDMLPVIVAFTGALKDLIREFVNTESAASALGASNGIRTFAENAGRELAKMVDYVTTSVKELRALVDFVETAGTIIGKGVTFDFSGAKQAGADFRARYGLDENGMGIAGTKAGQTFVQKFDAQLSGAKRAAFAATDPRRVDVKDGKVVDSRATLKYAGATSGGGKAKKDNSAAQEAKAQLAADLADIKNAQDAFANAFQNSEKLLEAMHSAGLTDESDYYAEKRRLLDENTRSQISAQQQTIARLQQEQLTGKDAIDNARKIADEQAKLTKIQENAATQVTILGIQQESAFGKIKAALFSARAAAQDYFDTVNRGYARELAGIGQGSKNREFLSGVSGIEDKFQQQRQDLENQRSQAALLSGGTLTAQAQKQYSDQLDILNEFQAKALGAYKDHYSKLNDAQKDWLNGATEALANYRDEAANVAKQTEEAFTGAFKGIEDALVNFVKTGKLDFKSLVDSIIGDIARMAIKQSITGPLANLLSGALGASGASGGQDTAGFEKLIASFAGASYTTGGFTGMGAANDPAGIVHKGEYVLNAEQTRRIGVSNLDRGNFGGTNVFNVNIPESVSRNTGAQIAAEAQRKLAMGSRNT